MKQLFPSTELFSKHHPSELLGSSHSTKHLHKCIVPDVTRRRCSTGSGDGFLEVPPLQACPEQALRKQDLQQTWERSARATIAACLSPWEILLVAQTEQLGTQGSTRADRAIVTGMSKEGRN